MDQSGIPPEWLLGPALAVLDDLQGGMPIAGLQIVATRIPDLNGLTLGVAEPSVVPVELTQLPDDLDPDQPTEYGGGNWVPRSLTGPPLLALVADILQEDLAETAAGWAQPRPPCPQHSHPASPVVHEGEAWWICPRTLQRCTELAEARFLRGSHRQGLDQDQGGGAGSDAIGDRHGRPLVQPTGDLRPPLGSKADSVQV